MRPALLIKIAMRSIARNKTRSLLTMLGIIIGVSAVLLMVAVGQGARSQIAGQIRNLGTNLMVISPGSATQSGVSRGAGSLNRLTLDDAAALSEQAYLLSGVSPVILAPSQIVGGEGNWRALVQGVSPEYAEIRDWPVESGIFFDHSDVRARRRVAVIGATVAAQLFPEQDPVGAQIRLRNVPFEVIGVLSRKGQTAAGSDQDDTLLAPYTTVRDRLRGRQFIAQILASTWSEDDIPGAVEEIRAILRESQGLASWEDDAFTVRTQDELAETAQAATETMTLLLAAIAAISLVVGGIGIMNIMLVSVTERTREIGIRMAVGARGGDVMAQFLVEAVVLSLLGGGVGVLAGAIGAGILGRVTGWSVLISPATVAAALAFAGFIGIFFGLFPARKASMLNPIEALRHE